ncbi:4Fe-4S binding protein, partial [bacterium]|nr:4Fe-4S binding protein [bacterium]
GKGAITMQNNLAVVDYNKCEGCSLCSQVCSTGAIRMTEV